MDYAKLTPGTEIYYTGDRANLPAQGKILASHGRGRFYDILLINEEGNRVARMIPVGLFDVPGRRFEVMSERKARREQEIKELYDRMVK